MKTILAAATLLATASFAHAAPQTYNLDPSHSQVVFSYDHLGFSTTYGMFSGFDGTIEFDAEAPENSSVSIEIPVSSMLTGWDARDQHFLSGDFFNADANPVATFQSTSIEPTGENTATMTGDLTIAGTTQPVTFDLTFNNAGVHPMQQKEWMGANATTTIMRSDFGLGAFAPNVGDEVELIVSLEAGIADE